MVDLEISQHADVRIACDDLYKIEKAAAELGFSSPALKRARDLLNTMSARVSLLETRAPDPAVVALVRAARMADRMIKEALPKFNWAASPLDGNAIFLLNETPGPLAAALAPFKHIEEE